MKNNISLIGFMGSGKTTIGKMMADRLGYLFFDMDDLIEISEQRKINDIFKESGEEYFRNIESKILEKVISNKDCVFACGGGVVLKGENMDMISENSYVVYLMISPAEAIKRLSRSINRPLLPYKNRNEKIYELINTRSKQYCKYADIIINNEKISPENTAKKIIARIKKAG